MIIYIKSGVSKNHNKLFRLYSKMRNRMAKSDVKDYRNIPVVINNFNRLHYLKKLIAWLEASDMNRIYIIDNASGYPPLLEYYKSSRHIIFQLDKNLGHMALWNSHVFMLFKNRPYVYTDPDVLPVEECPVDAVKYFWEILQKYPDVGKVGFGLKIDDLPDHYDRKQEVIKWESRFWGKEIETGIYDAKIDTTLALYRANVWGDAGMVNALRTGGPYLARHLPWYQDHTKHSEEEKYFAEHTTEVSSWFKSNIGDYHG